MDWTFHMKIHGFLSILPLNHGLGPQFFGKNVVLPGSEKLWTISHNMNQYCMTCHFLGPHLVFHFFKPSKAVTQSCHLGPSRNGRGQDSPRTKTARPVSGNAIIARHVKRNQQMYWYE